MELVTTFESLSKKVLEKYDEDTVVTIGILVADYRQTDAREYILNYLNRFDEKSSKYIDFFLPGYYMFARESQNNWSNRSHINICVSNHCSSNCPIYMNRLNERFYFDDYLFEDFLREFEKKTNISYTYNPMLILVEVKKAVCYGRIEFQDKMVIELDDGTLGGLRRSGMLFEKIFELAKREVNIDRFGKEIRMHYMKGGIIERIVSVLKGDYIEAVVGTVEEATKYRIKR